jgi:hypothetical protein
MINHEDTKRTKDLRLGIRIRLLSLCIRVLVVNSFHFVQ